jgi:drug/metabolite transporter (DMT)-like permease
MSKAMVMAIAAALLFGLNAPFSKLLLKQVAPELMAALLYIGTGLGMSMLYLATSKNERQSREKNLDWKDLPWLAGMIVLDMAAPILLMLGLSSVSAEATSLLVNFEIVATTLVALIFFKEKVSWRLWLAILLVVIASILLSVQGSLSSLKLSSGALLILGATLCWGFENNITRWLSGKNPIQIVVVKGFGSGFGALLVAVISRQTQGTGLGIVLAMLLGFVAYGLSIYYYIRAQRDLGAAKTSAFYSTAPFFGVLVSFVLFQNLPTVQFWIALGIMVVATGLTAKDALTHGQMESNKKRN